MKKQASKKNRMTLILLLAVLLAGLSLLLYPMVADYWNSMHQSQAIASYQETVAEMDDETYEALWQAAEDYNSGLLGNADRFQPTQEEHQRYEELLERFELDPKRKLSTFSKGMKKQVSVLLGLCTNTEYLLCDETFDGLDPVMRQAVKSLLAEEILSRKFTPVLASHSLREIEDICDHVGLLHRGGILFAKDVDEMKLDIHKVQCVIPDPVQEAAFLQALPVLHYEKRGSLLTVIVRGTRAELEQKLLEQQPLFSEILPLTLEEIFISETEVAGYDVRNLIY